MSRVACTVKGASLPVLVMLASSVTVPPYSAIGPATLIGPPVKRSAVLPGLPIVRPPSPLLASANV